MSERHLDPLELDALRAGRPHPHAERCAECRAAAEALRDLAARLAPPPLEVPPHVRRRILAATRVRRRWTAISAAAGLIVAIASLWFPRPPQPGDVDRSGGIDILDAYTLARRLSRGEPVDSRWDVTRDGKVDARDVDEIARRSVLLDGGTGQ